MGSKAALKNDILNSIPLGCNRYIEVFGGGGTILLTKEPHKFEVYNDFNSDLVNMFRCVKEKPLSFFKALGLFPLNSREEFKLLLQFMQGAEPDFSMIKDEMEVATTEFTGDERDKLIECLEGRAKIYDVERAAAFIKLHKYSYGGGGRSFGGQPLNLASTLELVYAIHKRLQNVVIENKDFEPLIKTTDRIDSFFYLDPPYVSTEDHYAVDFPASDHIRLYNAVSNIQGKFLMSYNDCDFIKDLYKDFFIVELSRINSLAQRYKPGSEFKELLIANFDVNERRKYAPRQLSFIKDMQDINLLKDYRAKRDNHHTYYISYALKDKQDQKNEDAVN